MPWNTWFLSSYLKDKKILTGYRLALSIKLLWSRKKKKKPYIVDYYFKPLPFWQTEEEKAVLGQGAEGLSHQPLHTCISLHGTGASVLMHSPYFLEWNFPHFCSWIRMYLLTMWSYNVKFCYTYNGACIFALQCFMFRHNLLIIS